MPAHKRPKTREHLEADAVIVVGERRPRDWSGFERESGLVVIGDALVPRRVAHAISEGRDALARPSRERARGGAGMNSSQRRGAADAAMLVQQLDAASDGRW